MTEKDFRVSEQPPSSKTTVSNVTQPNYYKSNGLSPLDAFKQGLISREELIGFIKGNVIKYTVRAGKKDDTIRDIDKAIDYLEWLKKVVE